MKTRTRSLEIDEDMDFQRREWRLQRIGWWALAAFVVAAGLGAFGSGPLSHTQAADPNGALRVDYERFLRVGSPHRLSIRARASDAGDANALQIQLSRHYFDVMQIERVQPEPLELTIGPADVTLRFRAIATGEFTVVIDARPLYAGSHRGEIRTAGGAVDLRQFTYF